MNCLLQLRKSATRSHLWQVAAVLLLLLAGPALGGSLDAILNPDGTVRAGARGSFSAAGYRMKTGAGGQPVFREEAPTNEAALQSVLFDGTDDRVRALVLDGSGNLYVGGRFLTAGSIAANHVAKWNGTAWSALGAGTNQEVVALALGNNGTLYAGGDFDMAGGVAANHVAKWDGSTWSALGTGTDYDVRALATDGNVLYAGGMFTTAGGLAANHIAKWNGIAWSALNGGATYNGPGEAFAVTSSAVYAGAAFSFGPNTFAEAIAAWNGAAWAPLANNQANTASMIGTVWALAVDASGNLYAGGSFGAASGVPANNIAKWNGTTWSALGSGTDDWVLSLTASGNTIYAGGYFSMAGGISAPGVAKWDGASWSALGTGTNSGVVVSALAATGNTVYAGGTFSLLRGLPVRNVARWNGSTWLPLDDGPILTAYHLTPTGDRINLNYQSSGMVKVSADNSAATFFSVARVGSQSLTLRLRENPTNASTGVAADAAGYLGSINTTATAVEAVYYHPAFVDGAGAYKDLHLELVTASTGTVLGTHLVRVVRPPLLLLHGLWSSGADAFPGLRARLVADGLYSDERQIRYADYDGAAAFAANAGTIVNHVRGHLQTYADLNISAAKVDMLGHSMGGLLTRQYVQSSAYGQDVNKIITLNTPHSGSPIPNFINGLPPAEKLALVTGLAYLGKDAVSGAVDDLSYNGPAIGRLNLAPGTRGAVAHTVTTTITLSPLLPVQQLLNGQFSWGGLLVGWLALEHPRASQNINNYLTNEVFRSSHDLVVGLNSQQGGLAAPYTDNTPGQWHSSGGTPAIQSQLEVLLRANGRSTAASPFTTAGFNPVQVTSVFPRLAAPPLARTTSTLLITAPARNTVITDQDSIRVTVAASADVTRIMLVCGTGTAELATRLLGGAGGSTYVKVPRGGLGRLKLAAFAFADSTYVQYDTLGTRLTTNATLTGLRLEPRFAYTSVRDSAIVRVSGTYSDGIERNLSGQPGLQFSFPAGGRARLGGRSGYVVGLVPGRDSLRVRYAGRTDVVPLQVAPALTTALATHAPLVPQLEAWPNPARQMVQVSGVAGCPIELLDLLGRVVRRHAPVGTGQTATLDVRGLVPGLYLLRAGTAMRRLQVE